MSVLRQVVPADPPVLVDGHTPFVARTPALLDSRGRPLVGRTVEIALVADTGSGPIHDTLSGFAVDIGDGVYTRVLSPRALYLHLADYAGRVVMLRAKTSGESPVFTRYRVLWQASGYPAP